MRIYKIILRILKRRVGSRNRECIHINAINTCFLFFKVSLKVSYMLDDRMSSSEEEDIDTVILYMLHRRARRCLFKKKRSSWVRDIFRRRNERGHYHTRIQEMILEDRESVIHV